MKRMLLKNPASGNSKPNLNISIGNDLKPFVKNKTNLFNLIKLSFDYKFERITILKIHELGSTIYRAYFFDKNSKGFEVPVGKGIDVGKPSEGFVLDELINIKRRFIDKLNNENSWFNVNATENLMKRKGPNEKITVEVVSLK